MRLLSDAAELQTLTEVFPTSQYLKAANVDGAVVVTTPQEVALLDVRKELNFASKVCA